MTLHPVSAYTYRPKADSIKVMYGNDEIKENDTVVVAAGIDNNVKDINDILE